MRLGLVYGPMRQFRLQAAQLRVQFLDASKFALDWGNLIGFQTCEQAHHESHRLLELGKHLAM